jgi:hypothetical protein
MGMFAEVFKNTTKPWKKWDWLKVPGNEQSESTRPAAKYSFS